MRPLVPIILTQLVTLLFGLLGTKWIAQIVTPGVYGHYALFLTLTQLGLLLTHSGIINHCSRYWARESVQSAGYARFIWQAHWRATVPLAVLLGGVLSGTAWYFGDAQWLWIFPLLLLANLTVALTQTTTSVLNHTGQRWRLFTVLSLASLTRAALPVLAAIVLGVSLLALSTGFAASCALVLAVIALTFRKTRGEPGSVPSARLSQWQKELRDYGQPFVIMGISGWLLQSSDRWIVAYFYGEERAGIYSLAGTIAAIGPGVIAAILLQWLFPGVFRRADAAAGAEDWRQLGRRCDRYTWAFLALAVAGTIALHLAGPWLMGWFISERFRPSLALFFPAGLAAVTMQVNQFQYLLLQGQHNSIAMAKVMLGLAALKTAGSLIGAAISWEVFLGWLILTPVVIMACGRWGIQRAALGGPARHLL